MGCAEAGLTSDPGASHSGATVPEFHRLRFFDAAQLSLQADTIGDRKLM
jgi:hypothetical protein